MSITLPQLKKSDYRSQGISYIWKTKKYQDLKANDEGEYEIMQDL
jgi:hypothetical protein